MSDVDTRTVDRWVTWLADLYPAGPGTALGTLQPDLLAEHLAAQVLASCDPRQLTRVFAGISEAQAVQALTVIGRAVHHHPAPTSLIGSVLAADVAAMTGAVIAVAVQFPGRYTDPLSALLPEQLDLTMLQNLAEQIPYPSLELHRIAAVLTTTIVDRLPAGNTETRATWLTWHALRLAEAGRREAALATAEEAVTSYRRLAEANPDAFLPNLATALNNLGGMLSGLGRREAALTVTEEAVTSSRRLAEANPDAFPPDLAGSLNNLGLMLSGLGRWEAALAATEEAVTGYRRLAEANPDAFLPNLAYGLWGAAWARHLRAAELDTALSLAEESVSLYAELVESEPEAFASGLRSALVTQADILEALGQREDADEIRQLLGPPDEYGDVPVQA
ncbi:tetratricopeptide repeat protein [Catellatospora tritici]|uniref:tetratricopeptide repeat protein n=1 Tax=Catellatospora tritici TaxID=2851566 RepID=UPI001C2D2465|nr:tetratricopeptide repeat protein [Catellatospora tritici]MBV1854393.1 tetratricopeptide repeat protein [Catellatospora tritici]